MSGQDVKRRAERTNMTSVGRKKRHSGWGADVVAVKVRKMHPGANNPKAFTVLLEDGPVALSRCRLGFVRVL